MQSTLEDKLRKYPYSFLTDTVIALMMNASSHSKHSKVKRLLAQGKLIHIRRGLYGLSDKINHKIKPHPFELAQFIYGPSYISLESALSYHQLIPERVHTTTSVSSKRSKDFHTPLGLFSYLHLPNKNFYIEVELLSEADNYFYMAKPWKAICDYVFCYKKDWNSVNSLLQSLRIERDALPILRNEDIDLFCEYYHHNRINRFLKDIKKSLVT